MKRVLLSLSALFILVLVSMSAQAAVYTQNPNPAVGVLGSGVVDSSRVWDNFTWSGGTINKITWWGYSVGNATEFTFTFYENGGNRPGAAIYPAYSGSAVYGGNITLIDDDYDSAGISYYSISLGAGRDFAPGTYWLSIYNVTADGLSTWGWQKSISGDGSVQDSYGDTPFEGTLGDGTSDVAFQLESVPLPAAAWLLGPGLAGLAALRCRRKMR